MSISETSPIKARAQLRRLDILKKRASGLTLQEIADDYGVSRQTIHQTLKLAFEELKAEETDLLKHMRREAWLRINMLRKAVWNTALSGNSLAAVLAALKIEERLAKLYGLDKPAKLKINTDLKMTPAEIIEEAKRLGLPMPKELIGNEGNSKEVSGPSSQE